MKKQYKQLMISGSIILALISAVVGSTLWSSIVGPVLETMALIVGIAILWWMLHDLLFIDKSGCRWLDLP